MTLADNDSDPSVASPHSERTALLRHDSNQQDDTPDTDVEHASAAKDDETILAEETPTARTLIIMVILNFGTFLAALDATIVATLAAPIASSFNSFSLVAWVASAYMIATAAVLPLSGKLTDIFGRRAGLLWCNSFFALGNLISGLAGTESVMILGRIIAGVGGGGLHSICTFVASDLIPLRQRGAWQGIGNLATGLGASLGGVYGGWLHGLVGWRWAFLSQVPSTALSIILVYFCVDIPVQDSHISRLKRVDFTGAFTLVLSVVLLLVGLNIGGNTVPWDHPLVLTSLPLSVVVFAAFLYHEAYRAAEPIIHLSLLRRRTVAAVCAANWLASAAIDGLIFYGPLYFEVRGRPPFEAGLRLVPFSVGFATGSAGAGLAMGALGRYRGLNAAVQAVDVAGFALLATVGFATPPWVPTAAFSMAGLGHGGLLTVATVALVAAVPPEAAAVATAAAYACRSTGSVVGIAVCSLVFQNWLQAGLWARLGRLDGAARVIPAIRDRLDVVRTLPEAWRLQALAAYDDALRGVFATMLVMAFAAGVASVCMREHKLYSTLNRGGAE